ncbi:tetratricopeptide repeat-containing sensor histidine kinase [Dyadobacter arcticus]|uniref:tetratricopeptide repeat-containing sensor histidine kinase n=1 Tax=Dyadobacter arcticus TaxID=1078754 RepID=UPI0014242732|nr:tetratricopeptide repeat protein [Dyadobacter arcticus]
MIFLLPSVSKAQQAGVDSLLKILPTLKGRPRIDCLNEIAEHCLWTRSDSVAWYAQKALEESSAIHYQKGIDIAWFSIGTTKIVNLQNVEAERLMRRSLAAFEGVDAYHTGWSMLYLADLLSHQCKYDSSITLLEASIPILRIHDKPGGDGVARALTLLGLAYGAKGDYETALDRAQKSYTIRNKTGDNVSMACSLHNLGSLYGQVGDNETAFSYYRQALRLYQTVFEPFSLYADMARLFSNTEKLDSAHIYVNKALRISRGQYGDAVSGEIDLKEFHYDKAIPKFQKSMVVAGNNNGREDVVINLLNLSKAFIGKKQYQKALGYASEAYAIADAAGARPVIRDASGLLSDIYNGLGKADSAYHFLSLYTKLKSEVLNDQFKGKLFAFRSSVEDERQQAKIELLSKAKIISEQELKRESSITRILIGSIVVMLLLAIVIFRNITLSRRNVKLEAERFKKDLQVQQMENDSKETELLQKAERLEMKALRAQMNPHFIFNCLSSINRFILVNNREEASDYLTKFSRLIRLVLQNSEKTLITLEAELDMLRLYLEMERLRFRNAFNYRITFMNTIDSATIFIPPLLMQPFAENAIWHGLMHKEGVGDLEIALSIDGKILNCIITDNGLGRQQAAKLKLKSAGENKSMGMQITVDRLALLNQLSGENAFFDIEDILDDKGSNSGTKVILKMQYKNLMEAYE